MKKLVYNSLQTNYLVCPAKSVIRAEVWDRQLFYSKRASASQTAVSTLTRSPSNSAGNRRSSKQNRESIPSFQETNVCSCSRFSFSRWFESIESLRNASEKNACLKGLFPGLIDLHLISTLVYFIIIEPVSFEQNLLYFSKPFFYKMILTLLTQ